MVMYINFFINNILVTENICKIFAEHYYYENMIVFKSMNLIYELAEVSTIYTAHTDI
jgi:hypothetical protein